ncbi:hypothetical protein PT974_04341 [Cladobotryum mycophilum]|uniref:Uncharacterized protein n=1 Tax=Cladobotryum mycophilum TaxID=491253 RepID=A0ABR0SUU0_9HYPO
MCTYRTFNCPVCHQWMADKLSQCDGAVPLEGLDCGEVKKKYHVPYHERCKQCYKSGRGRDWKKNSKGQRDRPRSLSPAASVASDSSTVYPESSISGYHGDSSGRASYQVAPSTVASRSDAASLCTLATDSSAATSAYPASSGTISYVSSVSSHRRPSHSGPQHSGQGSPRYSHATSGRHGRSEASYASTESTSTITSTSRSSRRPSHSDERSRTSSYRG